jgi:hypothetical protein
LSTRAKPTATTMATTTATTKGRMTVYPPSIS